MKFGFFYHMLLLFLLLTGRAAYAPAQNQIALDPTFGEGGVVQLRTGSAYDDAIATAIQPGDGKILVAGNVGSKQGNYLARYLPDGTPDPSFGDGGVVIPNAMGNSPQCKEILVQQDGKIVLVGVNTAGTGTFETFAVWRFLASGAPDPDFGSQGYVYAKPAYDNDLAPQNIFQLPDGNYVIAGGLKKNPGLILVGLKANGQINSAFGTQMGYTLLKTPSGLTDGAAAMDGMGNIYIAGSKDQTRVMVQKFTFKGVPDSTFGVAGLALTDLASAANAVLVQADGRILLAGYADTFGDRDFAVVRLLPDGSPDTGFGAGGAVWRDFGATADIALALGLTQDQGIVAGGYSGNSRAMLKLRANGALDSTFGYNGSLKQSLQADSKERVYDLAFDNQGNFVAIGFIISDFTIRPTPDLNFDDYNTKYHYDVEALITRYLPDGSTDIAFGCGGFIFKNLTHAPDDPMATSVQDDGRILVLTESTVPVLFRLDPSGALDAGFGQCGRTSFSLIYLDFLSGDYQVHSQMMAVKNDKITFSPNFINGSIQAVQLDANGDLNHNFGTGGLCKVPKQGSGVDNYAYSVAIQADNKLLVVGGCCWPKDDIVVARFTETGQLDSTFGSNGIVTITFSSTSQEIATNLLIQPDGRILLTGWTESNNIVSVALVRLMPNGTLDTGFGVGGTVKVDIGSIAYTCSSVLQADGKILIGITKPGVYRFNADGSLDKSFGINGFFSGFPSELLRLSDIAVDANGYIWACGGIGTEGFYLTRILPTGQLDASFGQNGLFETDIHPGIVDEARMITFQPDGKLLVTGRSIGTSTGNQVAVARFTTGPTPTHQATMPRALNMSVQPNPAPAQPTLVLDLPEETVLQIQVFDMTGRPVAALPAQLYPAGTSPVRFQQGVFPPGMYTVQANSGNALSSLLFVVER